MAVCAQSKYKRNKSVLFVPEKAYYLNNNEESLKEALLAYRCLRDEAGFEETAKANGLSEEQVEAIKLELSILSRCDATKEFENKLEAIAMMNSHGRKGEYQRAVTNVIFNWKEEYRRICRI